ncbi:MAG: molybdopterin oxidoreductase family protein [Salaquimonas sp.]|nr:molybdopterin oxidoreductase family protein [Salaquimonas sp.]
MSQTGQETGQEIGPGRGTGEHREQERGLDASPKVSDRVARTTCYMCACRCGINVHLRDGKVRYIEGNRDHPINRGVLCAKGSAGIMQHYSPARLRKPLLRTGERGSGQFREIEWEEALTLATEWLGEVRMRDPKKLAFFTGRDQSQSLTSWWAQQYGTPNYAAHGGFCSVNMAAAGVYTFGGAFWEFGAADWERTKLFLIFGVAEDHDSNPIKLGLSRLKERGVKTIAVNPVRTGYNAVADEWVGVTPGTDGLFVLSIVHELLKSGKVDLDYLIRYTNAPWLVIDDEGAADHGLFARDKDGKPLVAERGGDKVVAYDKKGVKPALKGRFKLADGPDGGREGVPVFELLARRYLDASLAPEETEKTTGVPADQTRRIAAEIAETAFEKEIVVDQPWTDMKGERHDKMIGRPVSFHAMRGISAHSNGFQTCRAIHLLQILIGSIDTPGGFRFEPPYPRPVGLQPKPHLGPNLPGEPLQGPHLGFPEGPEDLLLEEDGVTPVRIDKAFSWDAPLSAHGLMHMVISNAHARDPYGVDVLFLYMANMAWNSSMNTAGVMKMLSDRDEDGEYVIPKIIYSDAYDSEMVSYADLVLPDTTYLERFDCISLLDRPIGEPDVLADAIRWPVLEPDRDVRGFQSVLLDLGARMGFPGMVKEDGSPRYKDYADYIIHHERKPGRGPLAGWRGKDGDKTGRGEPNEDQLERYIEHGGFFEIELPENTRYYRHANRDWQEWAVEHGVQDSIVENVFQLYLEPLRKFQLSAEGKVQPAAPESHREQIIRCFEPLPDWYAPFEGEAIDEGDFPFHALTQRPAAMYHSWGSQNAWLRQIYGTNPLFVPGAVCDSAGLKDGDWAWVISPHGRIRVPVKRTDAVNPKTMWTWNAIGKRSGAWALKPGAPEASKGFLLNHLINELLPPKGDGMRWSNSDPVTGQAAWFDLRVRIEKAEAPDELSLPQFPPQENPLPKPPENVTWGKEWTR